MLHLMGHGRVGQIAEKHNGLERGCLVVGQITHPAGIGRDLPHEPAGGAGPRPANGEPVR